MRPDPRPLLESWAHRGRIAGCAPHPRNRLDAAFRSIVDKLYSTLTARAIETIGAHPTSPRRPGAAPAGLSVNRIGGFIEALAAPPHGGHAELAKIAAPLALEINDLFPIAAALHILEFAELKDGAIKLTAAGRVFAGAGRRSASASSGSISFASCRLRRISAKCSTSARGTARRGHASSSSFRTI